MDKPASRTVPALLTELATTGGDDEAVVDGATRLDYAGLARAADAWSRALVAHGIGRGDRVGILAGNRAEWLLAWLATTGIGAVAVGLNTWATARELAYQLRHAEVRLLLLEPRFLARDFRALLDEARALGDGLPALERVIMFEASNDVTSLPVWLESGDTVSAATLDAQRAAVRPDDIACLLYTSGSTALPKGVPLRHRGLIDNMWEIGERQHLVAGDRLWLAVSLFWSLACVNALFALLTHRGTIVLQHHFDAGEALRLIEAERCTVFYGTPNMALAMTEHAQRITRDLSSLRTGVTIGTPEQVRRVAALGAHAICNVYGLTEAYGNSTVADAALPLERRVAGVGTVLPGQEIAILDPDTLAPRAPGEAGEIALRGNVMPGYWEDPVRSAEAFTADGWFRTGDLGLVDDDGFLYYRGRLKEMVKTGGINVAPAEVEEILSAHPAVELAFVTGIPDPRLDEALAAVIVPRRGTPVTAAELTAHCRESLAAYKTPLHYQFVDASALPLTTTGKLKRNELPGLFAAAAAQ